MAPVNNESDGLWLRKKIGDGTSWRRKNAGRGPGKRFSRGRCDKMDTCHLSTVNWSHGRMLVKIIELSKL